MTAAVRSNRPPGDVPTHLGTEALGVRALRVP